eukprot:CAMPEP_0174749152 /NCGR_PEP_ID=MMETSP1094-20130205/95088_1 /TAXON_ID=156173 /ORGANISM="Chrysochromulina brevifilum, Strain UTEX LB 985" /LENGTH=61 /DNA_ID=CAMNT_0015954319 /DNA_START=271 /DNA_END=452 /DNA_ORIENTATION=+
MEADGKDVLTNDAAASRTWRALRGSSAAGRMTLLATGQCLGWLPTDLASCGVVRVRVESHA